MVGWTHFPTHKVKISGIVISGFGLGSAIFSLVAKALINPDNENAEQKDEENGMSFHYFDEDISRNVPSSLRYLSLIYLCISLVSIILLENKAKTAEDDSEADELCPTLFAGVKTYTFRLLCVSLYCSTAAGYYVIGAFKNFGQEMIDDDEFLTLAGCIGSLFNGSFRYGWAHAMERYDFKLVYLILCVIQTAVVSSFYYIGKVKGLFFIWICVINCTEGGNFSLFPAVLTKLYGKKRAAELCGVLFIVLAFSAITGFVMEIYLLKHVGYLAMFIVLGMITSISFFLMLFKFEEKPPLVNEDLIKAGSKDIVIDSTIQIGRK